MDAAQAAGEELEPRSPANCRRLLRRTRVSDSQRLLDLQCDDVVYNINVHTPISGRFTGKKFLAESVLSTVFPALRMESFKFATRWKIVCADARRIVCIMEADGFGTNGKRYDQRYMHMFEFRDGKIGEMWEFFDTALANDVLYPDEASRKKIEGVGAFEF